MIRTILMTGGTGMIGQALTKKLVEKGYRVIILTRRPQTGPVHENISYALWNIEKQEIDGQAVQQADHIIHLALPHGLNFNRP